ncbi:MAG: type IV pilus modification protein PilV [Motiliproteus sp.]|nr:type IV pilus modification protein PilV [Motiliproteus sp.]MCW9051523.1 type IV pilus modification protein PilV [Motiliproteus sp.]
MSIAHHLKPLGGTSTKKDQYGVGMLEVLIAIVLLTSTLLGATALQITGLQTNRSAYYRSQASQLAYDYADRIRINASYALNNSSNYELNTSSMAMPSSTSCSTNSNGCSEANLRVHDIRQWSENFIDVTGVGNDNSAYQALLPGGVGEVTASGATFTITVSWDEVDWSVTSSSNKASRTKQFSLDFTLAN